MQRNAALGAERGETKVVFDLPFRPSGIASELHKKNRICVILVIPDCSWPFHSAWQKGHSGIAMDRRIGKSNASKQPPWIRPLQLLSPCDAAPRPNSGPVVQPPGPGVSSDWPLVPQSRPEARRTQDASLTLNDVLLGLRNTRTGFNSSFRNEKQSERLLVKERDTVSMAIIMTRH